MTTIDRPLPPPPDFDKPLPTGLRMTEEEFIAWYTFEGKAEWVDGEVILMAPISEVHDELQWWIRNLLQFYVQEKKLGRVWGPQFVARLKSGPAKRRISRREPDILFALAERSEAMLKNHLEGPPDLAFEIVSPDSKLRDRKQKFEEYQSAGVREYWIVDPLTKTMDAWSLTGEKYVAIAPDRGRLCSVVIAGWYIRSEWLWTEPRIDVRQALAELGVK